ncbi:SprT family protein [Sporolactobacillus vineae]|uniref:SprT family protein n=1 Tax=Sporolactobacillus vineae TaxID=444463 RepID=UPI000288CBD0|nr:SprT family protein [Sporolactobacillus vineae]
MNDEELQTLVEKVSIDSFRLPFVHKALFNDRLRTTGGRYLLRSHNLEFNRRQLQYFGRTAFVKIVKHELCHYHLHLAGRGYRHRDPDFKTLLRRVGGTRFCGLIPGTENQAAFCYIYQCLQCGNTFERKRRMNLKRYVCALCGGKLRLVTNNRNLAKNSECEKNEKG